MIPQLTASIRWCVRQLHSSVFTLLTAFSQRENAYLNFRWTRKTVTTAVIGFIVVPVAIYYGTVASTVCFPSSLPFSLRLKLAQNRWNWNGKRKGEPLAIKP
jgi:hypothetical protein